jgi:cytochrome c-type biogenesis protein CcmF
MSLGAEMRVTKDGKTETLHPARNYYGTSNGDGPFSSVFDGESTSEVALKWGAKQDFWLAVQPDLRNIEGSVKEADRRFPNAAPQTQGLVIMANIERWKNKPVPMPVRAIVSPLVGWIWAGGAVALLGALLALWPSPAARRQEVAAAYKARVGGELTRV